MIRRLALLAVLLCSLTASASDNYLIGARSSAMGHASVTLRDIWSAHHNQAGLAWLDKPGAGLFYENRFLVSELGLRGGVVAVPLGTGVFGLEVMSFGYELYNESKYGLSYARRLGKNISVGVQLDYMRTRIAENYGSRGAIAGEVGVQVQLNDNWSMGAHLFNPNRAKLADFDNERIPTILRIGTDYRFSEKVIVTVETEKDIDQRPVVKVGAEYRVVNLLYLRGGVGTNPFSNSFGFGLVLDRFQLDMAASYHEVLGYSPQVSLTYQPRN